MGHSEGGCDKREILCIPSILRGLDLYPRSLKRKGRERGFRASIGCHIVVTFTGRTLLFDGIEYFTDSKAVVEFHLDSQVDM